VQIVAAGAEHVLDDKVAYFAIVRGVKVRLQLRLSLSLNRGDKKIVL